MCSFFYEEKKKKTWSSREESPRGCPAYYRRADYAISFEPMISDSDISLQDTNAASSTRSPPFKFTVRVAASAASAAYLSKLSVLLRS